MPLVSGFAYRIRNKHSQMFLSSFGSSITPKDHIVQTLDRRSSQKFVTSQIWYLYSVRNDDFIVINMGSGLLLNIENNSDAINAPAIQREVQSSVASSQTWFMFPAPESENNSPHLRMMNSRSKKFLTSPGKAPDTVISQCCMFENHPYHDTQLWEFMVVNRRSIRDVDWNSDCSDDVEFTYMTSFDRPKQEETKQVLLGMMLIPFVLVKDNVLNSLEQSTLSPFYQLHRYRFWKMVHFHHHAGIGELSDTIAVRDGLLSGNGDAVLSTLGVAVHVTGCFKLTDIVNNLIGAKIKRNLRVSAIRGVCYEHRRERPERAFYPAEWAASFGLWVRVDRFVLSRYDGTKILEWMTNMEGTFKRDVFHLNSSREHPTKSMK